MLGASKMHHALIMAFLLIASNVVANATSMDKVENDSVVSLKISSVNFYMTSIVNVRCDDFTTIFGEKIKTVFVNDKTEIVKFEKIFKGLKPGVGAQPDTRARVLIRYQNGQTDTLCVAHTAISLNGKPMSPAKEMVRFIEKSR